MHCLISFFFFFNDTATTEIYTLSLHDALPISPSPWGHGYLYPMFVKYFHHGLKRLFGEFGFYFHGDQRDRKSTRLNSSHQIISYAVFCLKKKKQVGSTF